MADVPEGHIANKWVLRLRAATGEEGSHGGRILLIQNKTRRVLHRETIICTKGVHSPMGFQWLPCPDVKVRKISILVLS